jgi:hypothetical protein
MNSNDVYFANGYAYRAFDDTRTLFAGGHAVKGALASGPATIELAANVQATGYTEGDGTLDIADVEVAASVAALGHTEGDGSQITPVAAAVVCSGFTDGDASLIAAVDVAAGLVITPYTDGDPSLHRIDVAAGIAAQTYTAGDGNILSPGLAADLVFSPHTAGEGELVTGVAAALAAATYSAGDGVVTLELGSALVLQGFTDGDGVVTTGLAADVQAVGYTDGDALVGRVYDATLLFSGYVFGDARLTGLPVVPDPSPLDDPWPVDCPPDYNNIPGIYVTAQDGPWDEGSTWVGGAIPPAGDTTDVRIDHHITLRGIVNSPGYRHVVVSESGFLEFDRSNITTISLFTLWVDGRLEIGDPTSPVTGIVQVTIRDLPIDTSWDPYQYSGGVCISGTARVYIWGEEVPGWSRISPASQNDNSVTVVDQDVSDWRAGDQVIVPTTRQQRASEWPLTNYTNTNHVTTIASISGNVVTLDDPLNEDKPGFTDDNAVLREYPVIMNMTRRVIFIGESELDVATTRPHWLQTGKSYCEIGYCGLWKFGRTKGGNEHTINNTAPDLATQKAAGCTLPITSIGTNQIGRYSFHFHNQSGPGGPNAEGLDPAVWPYQGRLIGCVDFKGEQAPETHKAKWSMALHNAHYMEVHDFVAYNSTGAQLVTEMGNESENVISHCCQVGSYATSAFRYSFQQPFGHTAAEASNYWFRGFNNYIRDNWAGDCKSSQAETAYNFKFMVEQLGQVMIPVARGWDPMNDAGGGVQVNGNTLQILEFSNNSGTFGDNGMTYWHLNTFASGKYDVGDARSYMVDTKLWHHRDRGIFAYHAHNLTHTRTRTHREWIPGDSIGGIAFWPADYYQGDVLLEDCVFDGAGGPVQTLTFGSGPFEFRNCHININTGGSSDAYLIVQGAANITTSNVPKQEDQLQILRDLTFGSTSSEEEILVTELKTSNQGTIRHQNQVIVYQGNQVWQFYRIAQGQHSVIDQQAEAIAYADGEAPGMNLVEGVPESGLTNYQSWSKYDDQGNLKLGWPDDRERGMASYLEYISNSWAVLADPTNDTLTASPQPFQLLDTIRLQREDPATGVMPSGLSEDTLYYVRNVDLVAPGTFQLSLSPSGNIVNFTTAGTGNLWAARWDSHLIDYNPPFRTNARAERILQSVITCSGNTQGNGAVVGGDVGLTADVQAIGYTDGNGSLFAATDLAAALSVDTFTDGDGVHTVAEAATVQINGYTAGSGTTLGAVDVAATAVFDPYLDGTPLHTVVAASTLPIAGFTAGNGSQLGFTEVTASVVVAGFTEGTGLARVEADAVILVSGFTDGDAGAAVRDESATLPIVGFTDGDGLVAGSMSANVAVNGYTAGDGAQMGVLMASLVLQPFTSGTGLVKGFVIPRAPAVIVVGEAYDWIVVPEAYDWIVVPP